MFGLKFSWEGNELGSVTLALSVLLGIIPLLGIASLLMGGDIATVGGLFTTLILLALSGIFMFNALWEARERGYGKFIRRKPGDRAEKTR